MSIDQYQIIERLDYGNFALVFKVRHHSDNEIYAMKKLGLGPLGKVIKENVLKEIRIMGKLKHPNLLNFKEAFFDERNNFYIITEFAEGRDILMKIKENKQNKKNFIEAEIWDYLIQMLNGLEYLKSKKIIHQEIRSSNIFLSKGVVKIGYLHISSLSFYILGTSHYETPCYTCPDWWQSKPDTYSSDVWSVGCVVYEMAALHTPFTDDGKGLIIDKVMKGKFPPIPLRYSTYLSSIISLMLQVDPVKRPDCSKLLKLDLLLRYDQLHLADQSKSVLHSSIFNFPSIKELINKFSEKNINKNTKGRRSSINQYMERKSKFLGKRESETKDKKRVLKNSQKLAELPALSSRHAQSLEYLDVGECENEGNIDKKVLRQKFIMRNMSRRLFLRAGTNNLIGDTSGPKRVNKKVKINRVSSEPFKHLIQKPVEK